MAYISLKEAIDDKTRFWDYINSEWVYSDEVLKIYEAADKEGLKLKNLEDLIEYRQLWIVKLINNKIMER